MFKEEQIRVIRGLINHLDNGTNVDAGGQVRNPVSSYTDETIAADEWQEFFLGHGPAIGSFRRSARTRLIPDQQ